MDRRSAFLERIRGASIHEASLCVTVLALIGVFSGLSIAALLSRDPREAGAYAVACLMIGGTMAVGGRFRLADRVTPSSKTLSSKMDSEPEQLHQELQSVAHDLKAPLISISSYLDLVASGAFGSVSDEAALALRRASQLSHRAQAVVSTALCTGSGEDGAPTLQAVSLERAISEVATALTPALREREASLTVRGALPSVRGEEAALFRIFANLVQNAIKFCPEGRTPHVSVEACRVDATTIEVVITDNGCGIPGDPISLTARGARGANSDGIAGHGLGLATVARLVSRLEGTVTFEPNPEGGTRARVTLPSA